VKKIIIPAGGKAERFNGILKELAPLNNEGTETTLKRSILLAANTLAATDIIIITNPVKADIHFEYIRDEILPLVDTHITLIGSKQQASSVLEAIGWGLRQPPYNVAGGLLLPDTVTDFDPVDIRPGITFGTFKTTQPDRFSTIQQDKIYTKIPQVGTFDAWGVVLWSPTIANAMEAHYQNFMDYDDMFNAMMRLFGYHTFPLHYYYDLASIKHYMEYIDNNI
jgi:hypothetical protein